MSRSPPRGPTFFVWGMLGLAALALVTGIIDVVLPVFIDGLETFGVLNAMTERFGYAYLFAHVLVHNLGLACLVPGLGLVSAKFERDKKNRELAALILLVAVSVSMLVAVQYLIQARDRFIMTFVIPLFVIEAAAVLLLAVRGFLVVRTFIPTPRLGWSLIHPARELKPWFFGSAGVLAAAALVETAFMAGLIA